jgi:16S rRNA (guanine966-N2)-methyltransferase
MAKRHKIKSTRSGRLRIVAGKWRSRLLDIADVPGLRPTSERIRETLFNWLAPWIEGARCLDLFAGTGALGLEALSRGARSAVFVEQAALAATTLKANAESLGAEGVIIRQMDALQYLRDTTDGPFDVVFLDPPFATDLNEELCRLLEERKMLSNNALVYIEQDRSKPSPAIPARWHEMKNKTAANVRYMLVRREV